MAELHQESAVQAGIVLADPEDGTKDLGMQARGEKMDTPHLSGTAPAGFQMRLSENRVLYTKIEWIKFHIRFSIKSHRCSNTPRIHIKLEKRIPY